MEWMVLPLKRYADFSGRSRRREYWMFAMLNVLVTLAGVVLIIAGLPEGSIEADTNFAEAPGELGVASWLGMALLVIWYLAVVIPSIAVTVRRLHDRDLSGWWYLAFIVASLFPILNVIGSIAFLVFMLLPGTVGENRFGPDPKDPHQASVFA